MERQKRGKSTRQTYHGSIMKHCVSRTPSDLNREMLGALDTPSPIDLKLEHLQSGVLLPKLLWCNMQAKPHRMKIVNNGHTVMLYGRWGHRQPYFHGGPFSDEYVFDNLHFHWGLDDSEGSEHTVEGLMTPLEMHTFWRKDSYLSHKDAVKKIDGVVIVCWLFKASPEDNSRLQPIVSLLENIQDPMSKHQLQDPLCLEDILDPVNEDFILYFGNMPGQESNPHYCYYIISRITNFISEAQLSEFRKLKSNIGGGIRNFRSPPDPGRVAGVFYILPSSLPATSVLLNTSNELPRPKTVTTNYVTELPQCYPSGKESREVQNKPMTEEVATITDEEMKNQEEAVSSDKIAHWEQVQLMAKKRILKNLRYSRTSSPNNKPWQY